MHRSLSHKSTYLLLISGLLSIFLMQTGRKPVAEAKDSREAGAAPVRVEKVIRKTVKPSITLIGTAEPSMKSVVASEIEGLVIDYPVELGRRIRKGEVIARIEKTPLSLQLRQAEAYLAEADENYKDAMSELASTKELFNSRAVSSRQYDSMLYRTKALKQKIMALGVRIKAIQYDLGKCDVRAPFSGFVVEKHTEVGQWLIKGGDVVTMVNMNPILVTVPVPDRYIGSIKPGHQVGLKLDWMNENNDIKGFVRSVVPQGNEKARTFPVQIAVENNDLLMLPGMSSIVVFSVGAPREALLVNKDAFSSSGDNPHIFVVRNGEALSIPVKKGPAYGSLIATEGALSAGEMVVVEGNERLRPGQKVRVIAD